MFETILANLSKSDPQEKELIICPSCDKLQAATVVFYKGDPWPTYMHTCEKCGYEILESEWNPGHV